jgi:hypothetical protein
LDPIHKDIQEGFCGEKDEAAVEPHQILSYGKDEEATRIFDIAVKYWCKLLVLELDSKKDTEPAKEVVRTVLIHLFFKETVAGRQYRLQDCIPEPQRFENIISCVSNAFNELRNDLSNKKRISVVRQVQRDVLEMLADMVFNKVYFLYLFT